MLPPALSEELCSLVPNVERLAFSAFFTLTKDGRVTGTSFSKCVCPPNCSLLPELTPIPWP